MKSIDAVARAVAWTLCLAALGSTSVAELRPDEQSTPVVTSARPDTATQGTGDLAVAVDGDNFADGAKVSFLVTGTDQTGGITVKSVRYISPQRLEATIDVAPEARTDVSFDIQVQSGARTGKGTEMFKVTARASTEGEPTPVPPGTVTDLRVVETGFNSVLLTWTATARDGYDPASGPVVAYDLPLRGGDTGTPCGPWTNAVWWAQAPHDPCVPYLDGAGTGILAPGGAQVALLMGLEPGTEYWAMARALGTENWYASAETPEWSVLADDLAHQVSFTTGSFPATPWHAEVVDAWKRSDLWYICAREPNGYSHAYPLEQPAFDLDRDGSPSLLYRSNAGWTLATRSDDGWRSELLESGVRIYGVSSGSTAKPLRAADLAFDPATGQATVAGVRRYTADAGLYFHRRIGATSEPWASERVAVGFAAGVTLAFNPVDTIPTIAFRAYSSPGDSVLLAERTRGWWTVEEIATHEKLAGDPGLAFDPAGHPVVTFARSSSDGTRLAFAARAGASWKTEAADVGPVDGYSHLHATTVAFDPLREDFSAAWITVADCSTGCWQPGQVRFCERSAGSWACETVDEGYLLPPTLGYASDGTAYLAYAKASTLVVAVRPPGGAWSFEFADWNVGVLAQPRVRIAPDGQPAVAYTGLHVRSSEGAEVPPVCVARRVPAAVGRPPRAHLPAAGAATTP